MFLTPFENINSNLVNYNQYYFTTFVINKNNWALESDI